MNVILHKIGLYKKSEIAELVNKTSALTKSVDGVVEKAKDTEDCYKAVLAMYNKAQTPEHAVKVLSNYCDKTVCTECDFNANLCTLKYRCLCEYDKGGKCEYDGECNHRSAKSCVFANVPPSMWGN